jgi:hypothetical protein
MDHAYILDKNEEEMESLEDHEVALKVQVLTKKMEKLMLVEACGIA